MAKHFWEQKKCTLPVAIFLRMAYEAALSSGLSEEESKAFAIFMAEKRVQGGTIDYSRMSYIQAMFERFLEGVKRTTLEKYSKYNYVFDSFTKGLEKEMQMGIDELNAEDFLLEIEGNETDHWS